MGIRGFLAAMAAVSVFGLSTALAADDCPPLKEVNTMDMKLVQNRTRALVSVSINGTPEPFLIDTGGFITMIGRTAAQTLQLPIDESNIRMADLYGHSASDTVSIKTVTLGRMQETDAQMLIEPNPDFGKATPYVGLLAPDYMARYDVEFDFTGGKLNYFSADHCAGHVIYWQAPAVAVVPITPGSNPLSRQIRLPVTLDGHPLAALLDTGSPQTTMTAATARRLFGLTESSPGVTILGERDGKKIFGYVFQSLALEGLAVGHPHIEVLPDYVGVGHKDPNNGFQTGSRVQKTFNTDDMELILGMDILNKLHVYAAFGERKLYITAGGVSGPAPGAATAAATTPASAAH